jgi:hypothetical protein
MSTKKIFANRVPRRHGPFVAEDGSRYAYVTTSHKDIKVGDVVYIASKLPVPSHSMYPWKYEIYPIVITMRKYIVSGKEYYWPQTYFGNSRHLVEKI